MVWEREDLSFRPCPATCRLRCPCIKMQQALSLRLRKDVPAVQHHVISWFCSVPEQQASSGRLPRRGAGGSVPVRGKSQLVLAGAPAGAFPWLPALTHTWGPPRF